jgi:hypothetical protein
LDVRLARRGPPKYHLILSQAVLTPERPLFPVFV